MKPFASILIATGLIACASQSRKQETAKTVLTNTDGPAYTWTKVMDSAAWTKTYNYQMFSIRDTIWTLHPDGTWFSVNGREWTKSPLANAIRNQAFLDYVYFNGALYGLGHFEGNIETYAFRPEICRTTDMRNWQTISANSNLPTRFFKSGSSAEKIRAHSITISGIRRMASPGQSRRKISPLEKGAVARW